MRNRNGQAGNYEKHVEKNKLNKIFVFRKQILFRQL